MKRYVRSSSSSHEHSFTFMHGPNKKFQVKFNDSHDLIQTGQITSIHPYDDAEYTWAKIEGPRVTFIRDGKIVGRMTIADYDPDWYDDEDSGYDEYLSDTFDSIAAELLNFDKDVKPIMVHN